MKVLIIDDEAAARTTLGNMLSELAPDLQIIASCANVPDGVIAANKFRPDLIFLDIEMPEYNGFEFFEFFHQIDFQVIFVTAYNQYALKAFEVSAVDYLLKPVDAKNLLNAIKKAQILQQSNSLLQKLELLKETYRSDEFSKIALNTGDGLQFVPLNDIILFEADRAYTHVHMANNKTFTISKPLRTFEDMLKDNPNFYRPHRSYFANLTHIEKYAKGESKAILKNELKIYISREKKAEFEAKIKYFK